MDNLHRNLALAAVAMAACVSNAQHDEKAQALADALYNKKYSTIAQRQPFGPEPANFDPDTVVSSSNGRGGAAGAEDAAAQEAVQLSEQENKLAGAVKVTILNVGLDGSQYVGFTDSTVNPPRNYYIKKGESRDEWSVVAVDEEKREATLAYSSASQKIELSFKLGGGLAASSQSAADAAAADAPGAGAAVHAGLAPSSAADRLRRRHTAQAEQIEALRKEREDAERRAKEDAARAAADRAAMQEQLAALADGLRMEREEREREREREEAERQNNPEPKQEETEDGGDME